MLLNVFFRLLVGLALLILLLARLLGSGFCRRPLGCRLLGCFSGRAYLCGCLLSGLFLGRSRQRLLQPVDGFPRIAPEAGKPLRQILHREGIGRLGKLLKNS